MAVSSLMRVSVPGIAVLFGCLPHCLAAPLATAHLRQISAYPDTAFVVSVSVGELRDLHFLVDTAATRSVIAPWVRLALGLKSVEARDEEVTAAGGAVGAPGYILPPLRIGDAVQHELRVVVLDVDRNKSWITEKLDGILGTDYLRNYDIWLNGGEGRIDLNALSVHPKLPATDGGQFARVAFTTVGTGFMVLPVTINGRDIVGVLDTGASRSVLNSRAAELAGISPPAGIPMDITGADGKAVHMISQTLRQMKLGGVEFNNETVSVGDLPVFRQFRLDDVPAMILGANIVRDRLTLISNSTSALFIGGAPNGRSVAALAPAAAKG
jgi:predicted aspartyl protease